MREDGQQGSVCSSPSHFPWSPLADRRSQTDQDWAVSSYQYIFSSCYVNNRRREKLIQNANNILCIYYFLKFKIEKMTNKRMSENLINLVKSKAESISFLSKENITIKHDRNIKISFIDLTPYLHEEFGFIDPDFPHVYASINQNQNPPSEGLEWLPAQDIHPNSNYSDLITNLQTNLFHKKSISHALIIINWFANAIFSDIFINELSNYHLYSFDVMIDGVFMHMPIDSYVPIHSKTKKQIFTQNYKGSVFPCLYEKLLAKVYGDYQSITSQFIEIVELQTLYCRQEVSLTGSIKEKQILAIIQSKLQQKSIVSFRTRNSIRLQSFGLESNYVYIILRVIEREEDCLVQFLELDGQSWIGRHSKLRSSWRVEEELIENKQIIRNEQYKQNYMSLSDMKGIGRQLIILNNTSGYHKNYFLSQNSQSYFNMYKLTLNQANKCMIRVNFKHKKCYNAIYFIQKVESTYRIIKTIFNQNKQSLYLELTLNAGEYYTIVYNTHPQEVTLPYNLTLFTSSEFVEIQPLNNSNETLHILEKSFLGYFFQYYKSSKDSIFFKQMYGSTGLAFIYIKSPLNSLSINLNNIMFQERKIFCANIRPTENEFSVTYSAGKQGLIIFRCLWSKKENIDFEHENINSKEQIQKIMFPPVGSIKVYQKIKK